MVRTSGTRGTPLIRTSRSVNFRHLPKFGAHSIVGGATACHLLGPNPRGAVATATYTCRFLLI